MVLVTARRTRLTSSRTRRAETLFFRSRSGGIRHYLRQPIALRQASERGVDHDVASPIGSLRASCSLQSLTLMRCCVAEGGSGDPRMPLVRFEIGDADSPQRRKICVRPEVIVDPRSVQAAAGRAERFSCPNGPPRTPTRIAASLRLR